MTREIKAKKRFRKIGILPTWQDSWQDLKDYTIMENYYNSEFLKMAKDDIERREKCQQTKKH
jgi:hypothetical protein